MPGETAVVEMKPAAELNAQPPKFVASQSASAPAPTADEEAQLRQMFQDAAQKGLELTDQITVPAPIVGQPKPQAPAPTIPVPEKFKTPEGTVDEEKLKASSKQLDAAIEGKQKSIDEMLSEYKAKEKFHQELAQKKAELNKQVPQQATVPIIPPPNPQDPQMAQIHQQILADMQRDPVGTTIMLNQAIVQKEIAPLLERLRQEDEVKRDGNLRDNLAKLAQDDPRILNPQYFAVVNQIIDEDPGIMRLKNPHKAAWNEAKERLRLGEASQPQARPSIPNPTLGGGAPPSVSTLPGPQSPQTLYNQAVSVKPYTDEGKAFEEKLREATNNLWQ